MHSERGVGIILIDGGGPVTFPTPTASEHRKKKSAPSFYA